MILNKQKLTVNQDGKEEHFTSKEFGILAYLIDNPDQIISAEQIYQHVWNEEPFNCRAIICVHICHIREKLMRIGFPKETLDSFWKQGYRFNLSY